MAAILTGTIKFRIQIFKMKIVINIYLKTFPWKVKKKLDLKY